MRRRGFNRSFARGFTRGLTRGPTRGPTRGLTRGPTRGFTLVELIIVMALIATLSALAMPRLLDRGALAERGAADELRALLRSARQLAVTQERDICVLVAAAGVRAVYVTANVCDPARPVPGPAGAGPLVIAAPPGVAFGGDALVRFGPRGQLVPAVNRNVTLGTRQIRIESGTGAAS